MVSSNGFAYCNNEQNINGSKTNFLFKAGDEITVELDSKESKMLVKKKSDNKSH
jgi:hypothetical protein